MAKFENIMSLNGTVEIIMTFDDATMRMESIKVTNDDNKKVRLNITKPYNLVYLIKTGERYMNTLTIKPPFTIIDGPIKDGVQTKVISGIEYQFACGY